MCSAIVSSIQRKLNRHCHDDRRRHTIEQRRLESPLANRLDRRSRDIANPRSGANKTAATRLHDGKLLRRDGSTASAHFVY
jgi:hypothetical protein